MPSVYLTRRETFSASHRLHSEKLSAEENKKLFGKCNSANGHGHNYTIEVTARGEVDAHGLVINLDELKSAIQKAVLQKVDHKHLNLDVAEFKNLNPTAENIAVVCYGWLQSALPPKILFEVKIQETENNSAIYRGE